ncbi:hypothetical protein VP01_2701g3 [Puccinia sorghi]|uniref:Mediator of RNA polymerase II transcription subunit 9 n=1 Tax=Puccinia sorghi TaxID=27349 RepID=A0A0L6V3L9_9BASI|nr:hypothetical protein VP01_2701g3 [Puccinia sorghi]
MDERRSETEGRGKADRSGQLLWEGDTGEGAATGQLDGRMAVELVGQLKRLVVQTLTCDGSAPSRLDISAQASLLKRTLATLHLQLARLPAADLSLRDQQSLISDLESRIQIERQVLAFMGHTLPPKSLPESCHTPAAQSEHPDTHMQT